MKLFVDDFRECPLGWTPARTVTEAIRILATMLVDEISLDHDIRQCSGKRCANRNEVFEPVARYIAAMAPEAKENMCVRIHTGNLEAGQKMADIIGISYAKKIFNPEDYEGVTL